MVNGLCCSTALIVVVAEVIGVASYSSILPLAAPKKKKKNNNAKQIIHQVNVQKCIDFHIRSAFTTKNIQCELISIVALLECFIFNSICTQIPSTFLGVRFLMRAWLPFDQPHPAYVITLHYDLIGDVLVPVNVRNLIYELMQFSR